MGRHKNDRAGNVTAGLIMVTVGVLFLTGQMGLADIGLIWRYWPLALIAIGTTRLVMGEDDRWGSGFTNLILGFVFLGINFHWMGLGWRSGWPLVLVGIGAGMTLRALFGRPRRKDRPESGAVVVEEERHV